jgi:protein-disulfide isomerase
MQEGLRWTPLLLVALVTIGATCNNKNDGDGVPTTDVSAVPLVELEGFNTADLSKPEHQKWSAYMSEFFAPCPEVAVPLAQCVKEHRKCDRCRPAAEFLMRQVRAAIPKTDVAKAYAARFDEKAIKTIVIGDSPVKGADDAVVTIVEFADFECPACQMMFPVLEDLYARFGKHMRVVYKHYPLEQHTHAKLAAQAAVAAQKQGQFWKMHRTLFSAQGQLSEEDLDKYAQDIGLDMGRFKKDLDSDFARERVTSEQKQGESLGVAATPTIFINGRECDLRLFGEFALPELEAWIELEIKLAGRTVEATAPLPSGVPSGAPSAEPSAAPSAEPSAAPSAAPSSAPSGASSAKPKP